MADRIMSANDRTIDQFAAALMAFGKEVHRVDVAPWVVEVEAALPKGLPHSYQSFIQRYSFPSFDVRGVTLFGNTGLGGDDELLSNVLPGKGTLQEVILPAGYIQIGRPDTGNFDAICFDTNVKANNREYPVVRIDHEQVLCNWRVKVVEQVWASFFSMVAEVLGQTKARRV
jgi:hypothetical protein